MGDGGILSQWTFALSVALLAWLLVTGCSGEEPASDGKDRASESSAAGLRELNAACSAHNRQAAAKLLTAYDDPRVKRAATTREAIELEVDVFIPILLADAEAQMQAIRDFNPPSGDRERVDAIVGAYQEWIEIAQQVPLKAVLANDIFNRARELAGDYGLEECELNPFEASG